MKRFALVLKKWLQGAAALFALYAALHSGGIVVRLGLLAVAAGSFALWSRSKRELDLYEPAPRLREQFLESAMMQPLIQQQTAPSAYCVKMPVRYPRPVYIHRGGFHLHNY